MRVQLSKGWTSEVWRNFSYQFSMLSGKFPDVNSLIMEMKCNQILSFSNYPIQTELHSSDVPISTCKFSQKNKNVVAVANENGIVCIQNVKKVTDQCFVQTHKNTVYDIAWMPQHSQFVTVSGDNSAKLWDCRESNINLISVFRGHKRSVRCVSFKPENTGTCTALFYSLVSS